MKSKVVPSFKSTKLARAEKAAFCPVHAQVQSDRWTGGAGLSGIFTACHQALIMFHRAGSPQLINPRPKLPITDLDRNLIPGVDLSPPGDGGFPFLNDGIASIQRRLGIEGG